jgi:hypothetical protein
VWWSRLKSQEVRQRKVLAVAGVVRLKDYQLQATVGLRSPDRINNRNDLNLWAQLNKTRTYTLVGWLVEYNNRLLKIEKAQDSRCELSCSSLEGSTCWLDSTDSALQAGQTPCRARKQLLSTEKISSLYILVSLLCLCTAPISKRFMIVHVPREVRVTRQVCMWVAHAPLLATKFPLFALREIRTIDPVGQLCSRNRSRLHFAWTCKISPGSCH